MINSIRSARTIHLVGPGSGAAVVQIEGHDKAIAISTDCNSRYIYLDPEVGGKIAVAEACAKYRRFRCKTDWNYRWLELTEIRQTRSILANGKEY